MHPNLLVIMPAEVRRLVGPIDTNLEQELLAAIQAIRDRRPATSSVLQATIRAVSSHRVPLYECASTILEDLATFDRTAMDAIVYLSRSTDARVRHNALLCLNTEQPTDRVIEVLSAALSDKSSRVRRKAADWIGRLGLHELLSALENALDSEQHGETRLVMAAEVARFQSAASC
ncbi:HEAT repeat domain-containing protein [Kinneretia aquatilis]|uniref:HEAT repeat domain-containing protein n=1 Tax=Kinneretia aquatilis TaxID=2070761 RepID=UPI0039647FBD